MDFDDFLESRCPKTSKMFKNHWFSMVFSFQKPGASKKPNGPAECAEPTEESILDPQPFGTAILTRHALKEWPDSIAPRNPPAQDCWVFVLHISYCLVRSSERLPT